MERKEIVWLNGQLIPKEKAVISPDDRGFLFADGVYEVMRWYGDFFLGQEAHHQRLLRSLKEMKIRWHEEQDFLQICLNLLLANDLQSGPALVYFEVTRGAARRTHQFPDPEVPPTVYAFAVPFLAARKKPDEGISISMVPDIRWLRCDIKSISLLGNVLSFQQAKEEGLDECIFVRDKTVTEASHSNVFFVKAGKIRTHPESNLILSGISRNITIKLAEKVGLSVMQIPVEENEVLECDEAFLTSTSVEVMPVLSINGRKVGSGKPGPVAVLLQGEFRKFVEKKGKM